jgi:CHAT domain-containing protein
VYVTLLPLGSVSNGDDVVGFTRDFLYAGANSIVSSLWKVDDDATNQLMQKFYRNLDRLYKRQALTQAQLTTKKKYKHPYYWAAFQLTGSL